jgi:DNA-binding transcriptional ArsR family regulator
MPGDVDIAAIGTLLADPARAMILTELLGGEPLAAGELARRAAVSPSGASNHLRKLLASGLVDVHTFGRSRVYRLGSPEVAAALEALGRIAPETRARTLRAVERRRALEQARTCYDHLAGKLGVALADCFVAERILRQTGGAYAVTARGEQWFAETLDIDIERLRRSQRRMAFACIDLTDRRPHLAGALGAAVAGAFLDRGLVARVGGSRALRVTDAGRSRLQALGVVL